MRVHEGRRGGAVDSAVLEDAESVVLAIDSTVGEPNNLDAFGILPEQQAIPPIREQVHYVLPVHLQESRIDVKATLLLHSRKQVVKEPRYHARILLPDL